MLRSEKRTLFRFLFIYLSSTLLLFLLAVSLFYNFQKHNIIDKQESELNREAIRLSQALAQLSTTFSTKLVYPHQEPYSSAIYNRDKEYIFGSFNSNNIAWDKEYFQHNHKIFYIHRLYPYSLGASYLLVSKDVNEKAIDELLKMALLFLLIAGLFFTLLGMFLGKLFIAPMKESIENMNRFIEDTTHEFNTPISTILTNIELIDTFYDCEGKTELKRIEIASKNLSRLYEDLTYLKLNHNYHRNLERLNFSLLIKNRIESFHTLIEAKQLILIFKIKENVMLEMDKNDAIRMIDNLLSNGIKYNKKYGTLRVTLLSSKLIVYDSGVGIKEEDMALIHGRFNRANKSEGGFGIGLDIIGQVIECYGFDFNIESVYNKNTEVTISW